MVLDGSNVNTTANVSAAHVRKSRGQLRKMDAARLDVANVLVKAIEEQAMPERKRPILAGFGPQPRGSIKAALQQLPPVAASATFHVRDPFGRAMAVLVRILAPSNPGPTAPVLVLLPGAGGQSKDAELPLNRAPVPS